MRDFFVEHAAAIGGISCGLFIAAFLVLCFRLWEGGAEEHDTTENQLGDVP